MKLLMLLLLTTNSYAFNAIDAAKIANRVVVAKLDQKNKEELQKEAAIKPLIVKVENEIKSAAEKGLGTITVSVSNEQDEDTLIIYLQKNYFSIFKHDDLKIEIYWN